MRTELSQDDSDIASINKAYCDSEDLCQRGQSLKTRLLAKKIKRLLNKAFKEATHHHYDGRYNEEIWHLTTALLRDIPEGVDANELLLKGDLQQMVNGFVHKLAIPEDEMIHLKNG